MTVLLHTLSLHNHMTWSRRNFCLFLRSQMLISSVSISVYNSRRLWLLSNLLLLWARQRTGGSRCDHASLLCYISSAQTDICSMCATSESDTLPGLRAHVFFLPQSTAPAQDNKRPLWVALFLLQSQELPPSHDIPYLMYIVILSELVQSLKTSDLIHHSHNLERDSDFSIVFFLWSLFQSEGTQVLLPLRSLFW